MDCSHAQIASTIKMAILNYANHLPLNLENGKSVTWNYNIFFDCDFRFIRFIMKKIITLQTTKKSNLLLNGSDR